MSKIRTKLAGYIVVLVAAFLLLFIKTQFFSPVKFSVVKSVSLPVKILTFPFKELKKILYYHRTFSEYIRLRKEVSTLRSRLVGMEELIRENSRLETLLNLKRNLIFSSVAANMTGRDPSNWNSIIVIDRGKKDGIDVGMPVVNALGVVGKIAEVSDNQAKVILISDPSFSVAALVRRSREVGLVSGTLQDLSRMRYLSADADVQVGDEVITSKLSSTFPEGLAIGEVISVKSSEKSPTVDCIIQPAVSLSQIEEVLVVQNQ